MELPGCLPSRGHGALARAALTPLWRRWSGSIRHAGRAAVGERANWSAALDRSMQHLLIKFNE